MHTRAASFASILKTTEEFLEENKTKMEPGELVALQEKLRRAKEQYQSLQERTEMAQKELESAVTAAVQQETEKVHSLFVPSPYQRVTKCFEGLSLRCSMQLENSSGFFFCSFLCPSPMQQFADYD